MDSEHDDAPAVPPPPKLRKRGLVDASAVEAAIAEDPFDEAAWAILEDFLLDRGDPRGEIIRAEHTRDPDAIGRAYDRMAGAILGPRARSHRKSLALGDWRAGYFRVLDLGARGVDDRLAELLATPAAALVRSVLFPPSSPHGRFSSIDDVMPELRRARCARSIKAARVSHHGTLDARDLEPLRLHALDCAPHRALMLVPAPPTSTLRALAIAPLSQGALARMLEPSAFPELLSLELAWLDVMFPFGYADLEPLFARTAAPQLARLVISQLPPPRADQLRAQLAAQPPGIEVVVQVANC